MGSGMYALAGLPGPFIHIVRSEFFYLQKMSLYVGLGLELPYLLHRYRMSGTYHYQQGSVLQLYFRRALALAAFPCKCLCKELCQAGTSCRYAAITKLQQSLCKDPEVLILPAVCKEYLLALGSLSLYLPDHRILSLMDNGEAYASASPLSALGKELYAVDLGIRIFPVSEIEDSVLHISSVLRNSRHHQHHLIMQYLEKGLQLTYDIASQH